MKIFKRLASATIAIAMIASISTVAFADALNYPAKTYSFYANKATVTQGTTTFKVSFGVVDNAGADIDIPQNTDTDIPNYVGVDSYVIAKLSDEALAAGIRATAIESTVATVVDPLFADGGVDGDRFIASFAFDKESFALNATTPLFTVTFTAPADIAEGTYKLADADSQNFTLTLGDKSLNSSGNVDWTNLEFVTVEAAGQGGGEGDDDTVTATADGDAVNDITAYTIANDAEIDGDAKKVITKTFDTIEINDATRVYVTINGVNRVFGSDLVSATSGLTVGKLTFGIIVDKNVDLTTVSDFRFE